MKLKICGIRDTNILQYACEAGVDFVGFIMANDSPRKISNGFLDSLENFNFQDTSPVFVFVNPSVDEVKKITTKIENSIFGSPNSIKISIQKFDPTIRSKKHDPKHRSTNAIQKNAPKIR